MGNLYPSKIQGVDSQQLIEDELENIAETEENLTNGKTSSSTIDWINTPTVIASPSRKPTEDEHQDFANSVRCVRLNLEDLKCFEGVTDQFQEWGITFTNAIALDPSNAAYPPRSGSIVLMGAPKNGWIDVAFDRPVDFFNCYVTSSQRTVLTAHDGQDQEIGRCEISGPNLAGSGAAIAANAQLSVNVPQISRISLYAFDGHLTVDDISFGLYSEGK